MYSCSLFQLFVLLNHNTHTHTIHTSTKQNTASSFRALQYLLVTNQEKLELFSWEGVCVCARMCLCAHHVVVFFPPVASSLTHQICPFSDLLRCIVGSVQVRGFCLPKHDRPSSSVRTPLYRSLSLFLSFSFLCGPAVLQNVE